MIVLFLGAVCCMLYVAFEIEIDVDVDVHIPYLLFIYPTFKLGTWLYSIGGLELRSRDDVCVQSAKWKVNRIASCFW